MRPRLFSPLTAKKLIGYPFTEQQSNDEKYLVKQAGIKQNIQKEHDIDIMQLNCLDKNDVITAKISDHHPMVHDGVLFWNVMMQGNKRKDGSHNNGFGLEESDKQYIDRLQRVAEVIAELVKRCPTIEVISLCEGPVVWEKTLRRSYVQAFLHALKTHHSMERFFPDDFADFYKPNINGAPHWGLLMLADKRLKVSAVKCDLLENSIPSEKLANRFQLWKLSNHEKSKYIALGHFPFGGDEDKTDKGRLSNYGDKYCHLVKNLFKKYENEQFILCADFNLSPYLISEWNDRVMDKITNNNSILLGKEEKSNAPVIKMVTVDGILLSRHEKQRYYSRQSNDGLFARLVQENKLLSSAHKNELVEYHNEDDVQNELGHSRKI